MSNITVSSDVDEILKKDTKAEIRAFLELAAFSDGNSGDASINATTVQIGDLNEISNGSSIILDASLDKIYLSAAHTALSGDIKLETGATVDTIETTLTKDDTHMPTSGAVVDYVNSKFTDRIEILYEAPSTSSWWLQADIGAKFSIIESFSSEAHRTFAVDRFSNVEINTLTLAKNNRYETRSNPSYTSVREFQKSLISDDGVVPTSSAVQKYIAETSPITVITGTGGETHSRYKSDGWLKSEITAIDTSFGTSNIEAVRFGSEVDSIVSTIFKNRAGLKFVDFGRIPMVNFEACRNCPDLERVIMRTSNQIGQSAFIDCTSLSDVDLGSVTNIGFNAFKNCTSLESITIPASVTVLGNNVFDGCSSLSEINCYADVSVFDPVGGNVFLGTSSTLVIHAKIESDWNEGTGQNFQGNTNVTVIKDLV